MGTPRACGDADRRKRAGRGPAGSGVLGLQALTTGARKAKFPPASAARGRRLEKKGARQGRANGLDPGWGKTSLDNEMRGGYPMEVQETGNYGRVGRAGTWEEAAEDEGRIRVMDLGKDGVLETELAGEAG